ncbi:hypothetical protein H310_01998 [Aphanomyces invadans]|uniref:Peptidyl-prolyl cis-trans isomerase n=1 Tax=Aphanomyces invadans TaxID=157072 RepID=A0A024UMV1_9STRA|nr:hypothetical protein H310_01998 [Aphanomyces invadans]ETW07490.1 hypothetical protein H310_01998 [Aphanomyces invadans]|eukprot:XP_008863583.1 hypothetical protein H310_01998 [Aphanomyces invadans]
MTQVPVSQSIYEFTMGSGRGNPVVYLDIAIGNDPLRRLRFELFYPQLPITVENFRQLCTGEGKDKARKKMLWYKGSNIHRVVPGFMMQGGDITHGNGIGGSSASSRMFDDEGFMFKHMRGTLSMAHQANTNKSQFFVCFRDCGWLNGKHVAFGQVIAEDLVYLKHFEDVGSSTGLPLKPIAIVHAGQLCGINFADATDMAQPGDENDGSNEDAAL